VQLVRVNDLDRTVNERRDGFSGAYLAIKDGKVTDQWTAGCVLTSDYVCKDYDGRPQFQLLETGKFKPLGEWSPKNRVSPTPATPAITRHHD
jgi:hypothetical protein